MRKLFIAVTFLICTSCAFGGSVTIQEYVVQIMNYNHNLVKAYVVTKKEPIRHIVPAGRTQIVLEDSGIYYGAVAFYKEFNTRAEYFWDGENLTWRVRP